MARERKEGELEQRPRHLHLVDDAVAAPVTRTNTSRQAIRDRRFRSFDDGPLRVMCRVCFARPLLIADHINLNESRVTFHCPVCGGSSLIRWDDAVALGVDTSAKER